MNPVLETAGNQLKGIAVLQSREPTVLRGSNRYRSGVSGELKWFPPPFSAVVPGWGRFGCVNQMWGTPISTANRFSSSLDQMLSATTERRCSRMSLVAGMKEAQNKLPGCVCWNGKWRETQRFLKEKWFLP